jgi:peptidoglycan hydrolase CwlO-like protein
MCTAPSANDINAVAVSIASVDIDIQAISARVTELQGQIQGGGLSPEIIAAIKSEIQALQAEVANYQSVLNAQSAQLALLQSTADSGTACCSSPECTGNSCCTSSEACASLDGLKLQILALQSEIANLQSDVDALNALIIYVLNL